jgi:hypothetical protein
MGERTPLEIQVGHGSCQFLHCEVNTQGRATQYWSSRENSKPCVYTEEATSSIFQKNEVQERPTLSSIKEWPQSAYELSQVASPIPQKLYQCLSPDRDLKDRAHAHNQSGPFACNWERTQRHPNVPHSLTSTEADGPLAGRLRQQSTLLRSFSSEGPASDSADFLKITTSALSGCHSPLPPGEQ